ncbi:sterol-4-alpha-carboxylate 3-dehydrogenase [Colletotrichum scovillei]|uniref:Sterol-4-alpha-carboxylate 3-dehydrogenase n=1 Tax=Colletotrichum scovillei TaxID=1209932 RepID=A0A9P7RG57_9PEZI|nr:sterol-4-alpha-carboxylate 3-dehydrogenase [Colletotrichum scovillei]KAF4785578.1 sterol-4-alpha-carboxylate 3-dehydrogenase [Colletotrichum scovillei]KAG7055812.1 sterol-4-alpha-carboxylate 3-dehydrogenase [Colletotrichum scovillei]KAG7075256.1 sterol-4-alpha-carboxylate 3-dehydrogenase [Colletotrichum scovillei]KAG7082342.1 sterol-4-alpha-carboxylate 3-dehydrogenase [Colletotrichum scovillei]
MASETYLVTGGCGFLGSHIVEKLLAAYPTARIAVFSRNPTTNTFPGVTYHAGDIASLDDVAKVFREVKPTVVFHCAGMMTVGRKVMTDAFVRAINVDGTRHVLDEAKRAGVKVFVTTSSASVVQKEMFRDIEGGDESLPIAEEGDDTLAYPKTKAASDKMTLEYDDPSGMRTCTLRPAAVHGERDNDITPAILRNLRLGRNKMQIGTNKNLFSTTYAGNAADAHLAAASKLLDAPDGVAGEAFFITNGEPVPFWDFSRAVWRAAGDETRIEDVRVINMTFALAYVWALEWVYWFRGEVPPLTRQVVRFSGMSRWYVIDKAKERLGWKPEVSQEEGIRRAVEWWLEKEKREAVGGGQ